LYAASRSPAAAVSSLAALTEGGGVVDMTL
jgi:hypothetical protein